MSMEFHKGYFISNESDFEKFVMQIAGTLYPGKDIFPYGRRGQEQHGVDLISGNGKIVIQCKAYNPNKSNTHDRLKKEFKKDLESCLDTNLEFSDFEVFIFATTYEDDTNLTDTAIELANKYNRTIEVWSWNFLTRQATMHKDIMQRFLLEALYVPEIGNKIEDIKTGYPKFKDLNSPSEFEKIYRDDELLEKIIGLLDAHKILILYGGEGRGKTVLSRLVAFLYSQRPSFRVFVIDCMESKYNEQNFKERIWNLLRVNTMVLIENIQAMESGLKDKLMESLETEDWVGRLLITTRDIDEKDDDGLPKWSDRWNTIKHQPDNRYAIGVLNKQYNLKPLASDKLIKWLDTEMSGATNVNLRRLKYYGEVFTRQHSLDNIYDIKEEMVLRKIFDTYAQELNRKLFPETIASAQKAVRDYLLPIAAFSQFDIPFALQTEDFEGDYSLICERSQLIEKVGASDGASSVYLRMEHSTDARYLVRYYAWQKSKETSTTIDIQWETITASQLVRYLMRDGKLIDSYLDTMATVKRHFNLFDNIKRLHVVFWERFVNNAVEQLSLKSFLRHFRLVPDNLQKELWEEYIKRYTALDFINLVLEDVSINIRSIDLLRKIYKFPLTQLDNDTISKVAEKVSSITQVRILSILLSDKSVADLFDTLDFKKIDYQNLFNSFHPTFDQFQNKTRSSIVWTELCKKFPLDSVELNGSRIFIESFVRIPNYLVPKITTYSWLKYNTVSLSIALQKISKNKLLTEKLVELITIEKFISICRTLKNFKIALQICEFLTFKVKTNLWNEIYFENIDKKNMTLSKHEIYLFDKFFDNISSKRKQDFITYLSNGNFNGLVYKLPYKDQMAVLLKIKKSDNQEYLRIYDQFFGAIPSQFPSIFISRIVHYRFFNSMHPTKEKLLSFIEEVESQSDFINLIGLLLETLQKLPNYFIEKEVFFKINAVILNRIEEKIPNNQKGAINRYCNLLYILNQEVFFEFIIKLIDTKKYSFFDFNKMWIKPSYKLLGILKYNNDKIVGVQKDINAFVHSILQQNCNTFINSLNPDALSPLLILLVSTDKPTTKLWLQDLNGETFLNIAKNGITHRESSVKVFLILIKIDPELFNEEKFLPIYDWMITNGSSLKVEWITLFAFICTFLNKPLPYKIYLNDSDRSVILKALPFFALPDIYYVMHWMKKVFFRVKNENLSALESKYKIFKFEAVNEILFWNYNILGDDYTNNSNWPLVKIEAPNLKKEYSKYSHYYMKIKWLEQVHISHLSRRRTAN